MHILTKQNENMKNNTWEILNAKRSTCNESEAKKMAGCLAEGGERVIAYFPTESAMRHADLIAAAPEMLAALRGLMNQAANDAERYALDGSEPIWAWISDASDIIAKAEGKA